VVTTGQVNSSIGLPRQALEVCRRHILYAGYPVKALVIKHLGYTKKSQTMTILVSDQKVQSAHIANDIAEWLVGHMVD